MGDYWSPGAVVDVKLIRLRRWSLRLSCNYLRHGKLAVTRYEVISVLPDSEIDIRFFPQTGRTHQLRVHAAHPQGLGRPIKGDKLYGSPDGWRLFLHAESLEFTHPVRGERVEFKDPMEEWI